MDLYSLHASIDAVLDYLQKVDPDAAARAKVRYSCFDHFSCEPQEYGYATTVGRPLQEIRYLKDGQPKRVRFWAMRAKAGTFAENDEVDELRWLPPNEAQRLLSPDRDRAVLDDFLRDIGSETRRTVPWRRAAARFSRVRPLFTETEVTAMRHGMHCLMYTKMGAHPDVVDGVAGTRAGVSAS